MDESGFWDVMQLTTGGTDDPTARTASLRKTLGAMTADELRSFQRHFDTAMKLSYRWDLWGAAYVIHGGCSDDGFEYFRRWLISRGRTRFEAALASPDSLAGVKSDAAGPDGVFEFEEIYYVAVEVFEAMTGMDIRDYEGSPDHEIGGDPIGEPFEVNSLRTAYPRLWARYGEEPLQ